MNDGESKFDFDHWATLASDDPQAFERARSEVLNSLIESAPASSRRRLRGLQWQLDQVRRQAETPVAACMEMSGMMWDRVLGEDGLLERLEELGGRRPVRARPTREAEVIALHHRAKTPD